jgi:hypothetical protein
MADADNAPSTSSSTLTDEQHDWVSSFCGIDTRNATQPNQSTDPNAGQPNQSVDPNADQDFNAGAMARATALAPSLEVPKLQYVLPPR